MIFSLFLGGGRSFEGGRLFEGAFILKSEILGGRLFEAGRLFEETRYAVGNGGVLEVCHCINYSNSAASCLHHFAAVK